MNLLKLNLLFLLMLGLCPIASAAGKDIETQLLFSVSSDNSVRVGVVNTEDKQLFLAIEDYSGTEIIKQSISRNTNYFKLFTLTQLPDGKYIVKLTGQNVDLTKRFEIKDSKIEVVKNVENKPVFRYLEDSKAMYLSYLNTRGDAVNVFIEDDGKIVYEERGITDISIQKKYSLRQLPQGTYSVKLYAGGNIFQYEFTVM